MADIVERLNAWLAYENVSASNVYVPEVVGGYIQTLKDARDEIVRLRGLAGAVTAGPSFAEIAVGVPRRSGASD